MSEKMDKNDGSKDHFFIKPENTAYPRVGGGGGGIPLIFIPHEDIVSDPIKRDKGIGYLLGEVSTTNETKKLKDNMVYFVVDFKIRGDHPSCGTFLERINAKLLTFLDDNKTKAVVTSDSGSLKSAAYIHFPPSTEKIIQNIRPLEIREQIEKKIFNDESWKVKPKNLDIFIVPNIEIERTEKYLQQIKQFLMDQNINTSDFFVDKTSNIGLITAKMDHSITSQMLKESSFVFRVNETPKISKEEINGDEVEIGTVTTAITQSPALPEVCVIDSGLNLIPALGSIVSVRSHEPTVYDDKDYDDHGTPVAYLVAYGENNQARARIISHKIVSGGSDANLFLAVARAIMKYRHRARIFTCSITFRDNDETANFEAWKIDRLAQASNACVIFSAGNIRPKELAYFQSLGLNYPQYFDRAPVMPPASSPSVLCVGACSLHSNPNVSIAPANSPSPFTRHRTNCNALANCVKPEIVEHGGNLNSNNSYQGIGVSTYGNAGIRTEKVGTSFSTPIIAGHAAEIVKRYGSRVKNAETIKAILLSSCMPTANHPQFVGFGKPDHAEMLGSYTDSVKIIFEGELRLSNPQLKLSVPANRIAVYIPGGVDKIELTLVHSDNYNISSHLGLFTFIEIVPEKPARDTSPPPDIGDLSGREHVKRVVWNYQKAVRGVWFFMLIPHHIGIPYDKRENVILRYGGVIKLTTSSSSKTNLIEELKGKEYLLAQPTL